MAAVARLGAGVTPAQVVLRWALQRGWLVVPKTSTSERLETNHDVFGFELNEEEMAAISALSRRHHHTEL